MKYAIKVNEVRNSENIRGIASVTLGDSFNATVGMCSLHNIGWPDIRPPLNFYATSHK